MKKAGLIIIITLGILTAEESQKNHIVVYGSIETQVPADNATFSFKIKGNGSSLEMAVNDAKKKVSEISQALFAFGLEEKNLRTSYFSGSASGFNVSFITTKRDYEVYITISVNLDDLSLLEKTIMTISKYKPERINDIRFRTISIEDHKSEALQKAILKANEKAQILATNTNSKLAKVLQIEEIIDWSDNITVTAEKRYNKFIAYEVGSVLEQSGLAFFPQYISITAKVKLIIAITPDTN